MIAILSPAKSLDLEPVTTALPRSEPAFRAQAAQLAALLRERSPDQLQQLMDISDELASLNHARYQQLVFPLREPTSLPAALLFVGDVYRGLDARSLDDDALGWANTHLRILSGLYGLLRPLDLTHPYRLEMGTRLPTERGATLYAWWGKQLAAALDEAVAGHPDPTIVDLASKEYGRAVPTRALQAPRLEVQFKELRAGKPRVISFFAKHARGRFARWMVEQRVERRDDLRGFDWDGYAWSESLSAPSRWVFLRESSSSS